MRRTKQFVGADAYIGPCFPAFGGAVKSRGGQRKAPAAGPVLPNAEQHPYPRTLSGALGKSPPDLVAHLTNHFGPPNFTPKGGKLDIKRLFF